MKQVHRIKKALAWLLAVTLLLGASPMAFAEGETLPPLTVSDNPLISPLPIASYTQTEDEFLNILLMGLDLSFADQRIVTSAAKKNMLDCHADAVLLAAVNLTRHTVSLISIPRDTLVYVPGVRGVYKANNAFNCADDPTAGCYRTCEAVSQLLGGVKVERFLAVDIEAMIKLCDAMGGVDFDMEMTYTGAGGKYTAGWQHLDGVGILDYVRARQNSSGHDYTDIARTRRQRKMMEAIYQKLRDNLHLINDILDVISKGEINVFSNLDINDLFYLMQVFMSLDKTVTASYGLEGEIRLAFGTHGWNYCFTDQAMRGKVLQEVFGLEAEDQKYASFAYTEWLKDTGFAAARQIILAGQIVNFGRQNWKSLNDTQRQALIALADAYNTAVPAFETAAETRQEGDILAMNRAVGKVTAGGKAAAKALRYMEDANWASGLYYFRDPVLTEYTDIDWR